MNKRIGELNNEKSPLLVFKDLSVLKTAEGETKRETINSGKPLVSDVVSDLLNASLQNSN